MENLRSGDIVNDQTQHNHPPRCCCISINDEQFGTYRTDPCPMCIEHGELAQLAEWKPEYPGQPEPQYPCCHQTIGRPHTDYCRTGADVNPMTEIEVTGVVSSARFQTDTLCPHCSAPMVELHVGGIHDGGVVELPDLTICLDCGNPAEAVRLWRAQQP